MERYFGLEIRKPLLFLSHSTGHVTGFELIHSKSDWESGTPNIISLVFF